MKDNKNTNWYIMSLILVCILVCFSMSIYNLFINYDPDTAAIWSIIGMLGVTQGFYERGD